ncbi:TetR/AcrR family transcriptional regulator [Rhodococcus maanshanensis]|uniref:TetR/AcrR family transcriptional regulator n=1 Tax=Rhodococcus maanshanensis TaxID=183556 RepID=UPI0022B42297|nr:TetR/AcrR family transcriptional regulator [Rhodococcus maanshanensis]MCZ4557563.1 TetR/AcrR family transcriptional regulator [Rhodococcus maanshanensis]
MATTRDAEQVGAARRADIVSSAITLFAANGYRGTSLAAVARESGITKSGLLHHFPSKEVLLTAVLADLDRQTFDSVEIGRDYEGAALVRALDIVDEIVARNQRNRELTRLAHVGLFHSDDTPELAREWAQGRIRSFRTNLADLIENGVEAGEVRADVDPTALASVIIGAISGLEEQWLQDESFDMVGAMKALTTVLRRDLTLTRDQPLHHAPQRGRG